MSKKKKSGGDGREPVKLDSEIVERVRNDKKVTGVNISVFFEKAATEKLDRQKLHKA